MYCQSCGAEQTQGLIYCNRCGANLNSSAIATTTHVQVPAVSVTKPIFFIGLVLCVLSLGGFAVLTETARELSSNANFDRHLLSVIVILGFVTIMVVDVMLVWLLSRIINASLRAGSLTAPAKELATLNTPNVRQINAPRDYLGSVTEQTTRTLEPVYKEPRA